MIIFLVDGTSRASASLSSLLDERGVRAHTYVHIHARACAHRAAHTHASYAHTVKASRCRWRACTTHHAITIDGLHLSLLAAVARGCVVVRSCQRRGSRTASPWSVRDKGRVARVIVFPRSKGYPPEDGRGGPRGAATQELFSHHPPPRS